MSGLARIEPLGDVSKILALLTLVDLTATACQWSDSLLTVHDGGGAITGVCGNYRAIDASTGPAVGLVAWYSCESAAGSSGTLLSDSAGHANDATLHSDADAAVGYGFASGKVGNALNLIGADQAYVALPVGILTGACEATIATWVYVNNNDNPWARIWDFGQNANVYMFLTTNTNYDRLAKFAITVSGADNEQAIEAPSAVPVLKWTHVAVVLGPSGGILYLDGTPVGTNSMMTLRPADLGSTVNNYIGRSQYSADPYLDGIIDEFRVYDRALSPNEIQALANGS